MGESPFTPGYKASDSPRPAIQCRFCKRQMIPREKSQVSPLGLAVCVLLVFICCIFCWAGLLITETHRYCSICGMKLD